MLIDTPYEITRYADIDRATWPTCKDIDVILGHEPSMTKRDGRDKPGHDGVTD